MPTFLNIQSALLRRIDENTITDALKAEINLAVQDACNRFNFSNNTLTQTLTLVAGVDNLNSDFNYTWGIDEGNAVYDGVPLTRIDIADAYRYSDGDLVYWITWDNTNKIYVFNSKLQSGDVEIVYHFIPADMTADGDICLISDVEAIAILAASKYMYGEEQDSTMIELYEKPAWDRLQKMYNNQLAFGPKVYESSIVSQNSSLNTRGI